MTDDNLRARLRDADPAAGLAPLTTDRVTDLLGNLPAGHPAAARPAPARRPRTVRRLALVAAGLVLAGVAVAAGAVLRAPGDSGPVAQPPVSPAVVTVTRIVAGGGAAKCAPPSAAVLATAPLAFAGTVERVAGGLAVLTVTHRYAGTPTAVVEVAQGDGSSEALIGATVFEPGREYLVAAAGGQALDCGYSGLATPELRTLYDAAF